MLNVKKTILAVLLAAVMIFSLAGCGSSDQKESSGDAAQTAASDQASGTGCTYDYPGVGFGFELPDGVKIEHGYLQAADNGELVYGSDVMLGQLIYYNMTLDELKALPKEDTDKVRRGFGMGIFCVKGAANEEEAKEKITSTYEGLVGENIADLDRAFMDSLKQIHQDGDYQWFSAKYPSMEDQFEGDNAAEYKSLYDASDDIVASMQFCEPNVWHGAEDGEAISFETKDLDGNPIQSDVLFSRNKVTMINIWATTCGPCVNEMPDIEKISQDAAARGGAVVGLVADVTINNNVYLEDAQDIISSTGVTFLNIRAWDGFADILPLVGTPTTYFVDSEGKLLGEPIVGANAQAYEERMNEYLGN